MSTMSEYVGFDSKRFVRGRFEALIGVGITIQKSKFEEFKEVYNNFMKELFNNNNIPYRRPIYKSYDLKRLFFSQGIHPIEDFVKETKGLIDFVDFYYSYFKNKTMDQKDDETKDKITDFIDVYYNAPKGKQTVSAIKFMNIIEPTYPAICVWSFINSNPLKCDADFYIDNFKALPSKMWNELSNIKTMNVVYSGGKCNYLVSAADLYLCCIEDRIREGDVPLNRSVHKILHPDFTGKFDTNFVGTHYLYPLAPASKSEISINSKILHPIYYIFTEGSEIFSKTFGRKGGEQTFLEQSPFLDKVLSIAAKENGSVKFYDPTQDNSFILPSDKFYYYGEKGKEKIETLKRLGFTNEISTAENI